MLTLWEEGADDEREAEGDEDALDEEDRVVAPAEDGERRGYAPHVDLAEKGSGPFGLEGGGGDSGFDGGGMGGGFGTGRHVGVAWFGGGGGRFSGGGAGVGEGE